MLLFHYINLEIIDKNFITIFICTYFHLKKSKFGNTLKLSKIFRKQGIAVLNSPFYTIKNKNKKSKPNSDKTIYN